MKKLILILFVICTPITQAYAKSPSLDAEDIKLLTEQISKQVRHCKIWNGEFSAANFKNKTDESLDKEAFVKPIIENVKKKNSGGPGVTISGEISSTAMKKDGVATKKYILKVLAKKGRKILCTMKTQLEKTAE